MEAVGSSQIDTRAVEKLHTLVWENNKAEVEALLKQGQTERIVDMKVNGKTALHVAACKGHTEVVELLLKLGRADIHARTNVDKDTPLHLAALFGHAAVVGKLLQEGAASDLTLEDRHGDTPLHNAARSGKEEILKRLLSAAAANRQACVFAKNTRLRTPLHYAAGSGKHEAVALLLDAKEHQALKDVPDVIGALPFHFAARSGDVVSMERLAPKDVNVECNVDGLTALHYAAWNGRVDAVKRLLEKGTILKERTNTPLHLAAISKKPERESVVEAILTKFPESWKMANHEGDLAIGLAHESNCGDVVRAILRALQKWKPLLSNDVLTHKHKTSDATLLHYAAAHGTKDEIEWLAATLEKGKTVDDILDKEGRTPLHWAAIKGNKSTLKALANLDSDLIRVGNRGAHQTPLFLALEGEHMDFAEELLKCDKERCKAGSSKRLLNTDEWMNGVGRWFMAYYNAKVEELVKGELETEFRRQMWDHRATWLPTSNGGEMDVYQEIPPVYLALHARKLGIAKFFQRLSSGEDAVNKKGWYTGRTSLHWAVLFGRRDIVEQLCIKEPEFAERVRVCEEDVRKISPVQYATERNMHDIEFVLFKCASVRDYIEGLYRDRQIYVDSTNAILVGAALIASVTFAGWLQPPLGFTEAYHDDTLRYVAMQRVKGMRIFWIFNSLSFFAAIGTVQAGACGVLPLRHLHIGRAVNYIRRVLMVASLLMALSVVCVLGAFGSAGFIVLPPKFKFEFYMMVTVLFGGLINVGLIFCFLQRILVAPRLFEVWRRQLLGLTGIAPRASPPPDLKGQPDEGALQKTIVPRHLMDVPKPPFPWDDGIDQLHTLKQNG